jgi:hypothetical protein
MEKRATEKNGPLFMSIFLPHYRTENSPPFHEEMWGILLKNPPYDDEWKGKEGAVFAAPRGHAKSTIASLGFPAHQGLHMKRKFVVLISNTDTQAESLADSLRREFEDNDHIKEVFGNLRGDRFKANPFRWTQKDFTIAHTDPIDSVDPSKVIYTTRYVAKGMLTRIRGMRTRESRPDLLVLDDAENDEHVMTPEQRAKTWNYLYKALIPMLDPKTGMFVAVGTILHYESMLNRLLEGKNEGGS